MDKIGHSETPMRARLSLHWADSTRRYLFSENVDDVGSLIFLTLATMFSALLALQLHTYNSASTRMRDRAMQYALQAMGSRSRGELQASYAWTDAYRLWLDWNGRANLAAERGDAAAADRYRAVRDRALLLSPLLSTRYFDPASAQAPNLRAYESDTYLVESTALGELYARTMDLCIRLVDKTQATTLQAVLMGIAIALVALTPKRALKHPLLRVAPLSAATLIVVVVVAWAVRVYVDRLPAYSDDAVQRYAEGVGLQHQKRDGEAIAAFDASLEIEPTYAEAFYRRGISQFALGRAEAAARDFQSAWDNGRQESNVLWNLGWAYYASGRFADAIAVTQRAIASSPDTPALLFNLGAAQLAAGDVQAARESYGDGFKLVLALLQRSATDQSPPATLWADLDTASHDLDALITCMQGGKCDGGVPPRQTISRGEQVQSTAVALRRSLKEAGVSLEYSRAMPPDAVVGSISPLEFGDGVLNADGSIKEFAPLGTVRNTVRSGLAQQGGSQLVTDASVTIAAAGDVPVLVRFTHREVRQGAQFVMKVNYQGAEAPWLRIVESWDASANGERLLPIAPTGQLSLMPGEYTVEMYLDGRLMQEGKFTLAAK